jgi:prolipoprotein diacylglyceryltransferase
MNSLFIIDTPNGGKYYAVFYFLAFLGGLIVLVWEGRKRNFPITPWLLVISTTFLFFMIGTQMLKFSHEDWQLVFQFKELTHSPGRSVLGGILVAIPGLLLAKYLLKFRYNVIDAFALAAPLGMLIQRVGCLLAGCCYGTTTTVPWAMQYGSSSHAFQQHVTDGVIPSTSTHSMSIHPVPLYEIVACVTMLLILYCIRKQMKVSGSIFLVSVMLYGVSRFVTEFFRAHSFSSDYYFFGLTIVQLVLMVLLPLLLALILYRERRIIDSKENSQSVSNKLVLEYFLGIAFLFLIFSRWLSLLEILTLNLVLLPTLLFISWEVFKSVTVPSMRWTTLGLMAGSLLMMSQTLPERADSDSTRLSYNIFSIGAMTGNSRFVIRNEDCDGNTVSTDEFKNTFQATGLNLGRVKQLSRFNVLQYGINGYWGRHKETINGIQENDINVGGVHPYFQYDYRLIGIGVGFHVGTITYSIHADYDQGYANSRTSLARVNVFPSVYFRIGYIDKVFGEFKLANQFPTPFPSLAYQMNVGIGFRNYSGGAVRLGMASYVGLFINPSIPIGKNLVFDGYVGGLPGLFPTFYTMFGFYGDNENYQSNSFVGSIGLHYKFGRNEQK